MNKSILVVDDSREIRQLVALALQGICYEIDAAADGQIALDMAGRKNYALVITDLNMPNMDGLALVRSLRTQYRYLHTPLLMLTSEADSAFKEEGKAAGATGWMPKPFDLQQLVGVIKKALG